MAKPSTLREYRVAWEYARDLAAIRQDEIDRLRAALSDIALDRSVVHAIAMAFHDAYEKQAPAFGYETRVESALPWALVPEENRALMVSVVATLIDHGVIAPGARIDGLEIGECPHCGGTGLVEDEGWQPDFPGDRRIKGEVGHGYLRCGSGCALIDGEVSS